MLSLDQVREQLQSFLGGALSLDELEDWLAAASWNMHQHAPADVQKLVGAVELRLAEHSSGHLDEDALHEEFQVLLLHGYVEPVTYVQAFLGLPPTVSTITSTSDPASYVPSFIFPRIDGAPRTSALTKSASGATVRRRHEVTVA